MVFCGSHGMCTLPQIFFSQNFNVTILFAYQIWSIDLSYFCSLQISGGTQYNEQARVSNLARPETEPKNRHSSAL